VPETETRLCRAGWNDGGMVLEIADFSVKAGSEDAFAAAVQEGLSRIALVGPYFDGDPRVEHASDVPTDVLRSS
jgi:hypothetical protein